MQFFKVQVQKEPLTKKTKAQQAQQQKYREAIERNKAMWEKLHPPIEIKSKKAGQPKAKASNAKLNAANLKKKGKLDEAAEMTLQQKIDKIRETQDSLNICIRGLLVELIVSQTIAASGSFSGGLDKGGLEAAEPKVVTDHLAQAA